MDRLLTDPRRRRSRGFIGSAPKVAIFVLGAAILMWISVVLPQILVPARSERDLADVADSGKRHELEDSRLKLQNDVRAALLQGLGGVAVLLGAYIALQQLSTAREGQVTDRFTRAIDQLGNDHLDIRLGGIYGLERIAKGSVPDRAVIEEILTAFVGSHSPWPPRFPGQYVEAADLEEIPLLPERARDVQAALTVLARREHPAQGARPLDLVRVDLRCAELPYAEFQGTMLYGANLGKALSCQCHVRRLPPIRR
jgi:hypothetical protein